MSRSSSDHVSDYFLPTNENKGPSLFPSGLLMYDLPLSRRTASRPSNNIDQQISRKPSSSSPVPSVSISQLIIRISQMYFKSPSSVIDDDDDLSIDDESNKKTLTTSEDWWRQGISIKNSTIFLQIHFSTRTNSQQTSLDLSFCI